MRRLAMEDLAAWKGRPDRRPLLLYGARQVGKTWLVREFARQYYQQIVELNFFHNNALADIFSGDLTPQTIIGQLELTFNVKIDPATTLIFFDEIQESQRAMDSLKLFNDKAPQYHIVAAGSFLGVSVMRWPVGQTDHYNLYPMNFTEFLLALQEDQLVQVLQDLRTDYLTAPIREKFERYLREYFYVGGMPRAVENYAAYRDLEKVRDIQNTMLEDCQGDFNKHIAPRDARRVGMLWDAIPIQLAKENKKFIYRQVKEGGRAAEFEIAMEWLIGTGMVHRVYRVADAQIPLAMHCKRDFFKLYMLDIGLFGAKANIRPNHLLLKGSDMVGTMNGALAEQFVLQELKSVRLTDIYYWFREAPAQAELDFLLTLDDGNIVPLEVKAAHNTKARSLKIYRDLYHPAKAVRSSLNQFRVENQLYDIPLYMIAQIARLLAKD